MRCIGGSCIILCKYLNENTINKTQHLTLSSSWPVSSLQRYGLAEYKLRILTAASILLLNELTANLVSCLISTFLDCTWRWRKDDPQGDSSSEVPSLYFINKLSFSYRMNNSTGHILRCVFKSAAIFFSFNKKKAWLLISDVIQGKYPLRKRRCRNNFRRGFDREFVV